MRWFLALTLALACSLAGCRRGEPRSEPPAPAPQPAQPAAAAVPQPASAEATPVVAQAPAPATPPARPKATETDTLPVVELPPPIVAPAAPGKPEDQHDDRIYSWVDEQGAVHYGGVDDIPPARRRSARVVEAGVTVVATPPLAAPAQPADAPPQESAGAARPAERRGRGPEPERDAQGLPIPGTMDDTAATRASKAAGEIQIDPAAVERRHEEELRRMNCKQKDGVWVCG